MGGKEFKQKVMDIMDKDFTNEQFINELLYIIGEKLKGELNK